MKRQQHLRVPHAGDLAKHRSRARGIQDREATRQARDGAGVLGQKPCHAGMEGADPDGCAGAQLRRHPRPHLGGRTIGEGDAEQPVRRLVMTQDEVDRPACQRFRLAGSCPRQDELWCTSGDRRCLLLVQPFEMIRHGSVGITTTVIRTRLDSVRRRPPPLPAAASPDTREAAPGGCRRRSNAAPDTR